MAHRIGSKTQRSIAGFVYLNVGDYVKCQECHVQLHNWIPDDIPLVEHAKRNKSNCSYLQDFMQLGEEKIEEITEGLVSKETFRAAFSDTSDVTDQRKPSEEGKTVRRNSTPEDSSTIERSSGERLATLIQENERLRMERACKVCLNRDAEILFEPCHHYITCSDCAPSVANCPMCRERIVKFIKTSFPSSSTTKEE